MIQQVLDFLNYVDFSKDAEVVQKECPTGQVCTQSIEFMLDSDLEFYIFNNNLIKINNILNIK